MNKTIETIFPVLLGQRWYYRLVLGLLNSMGRTSFFFREVKFVPLCFFLALAGCETLPRASPNSSMIEASKYSQFIVPITVDVARRSQGNVIVEFSDEWISAKPLTPSVLGPGDQLEIRVWEPSEQPLIATAGGGGGTLQAKISDRGMIKLPFAPAVQAAGQSPHALASQLEEALVALSSEVQVTVRLLTPGSRKVSVLGRVAQSGIFPIEETTSRLSGMLAQAGVIADQPEKFQVDVSRFGKTRSVTLADFYDNARLDIALRANDRIVVRETSDRYVMLGATRSQDEYPITGSDFTLIQALAQGGGLRDDTASSRAVYLFRFETKAMAIRLLGQEPPNDKVATRQGWPIIYKLDMTEPTAYFAARLFKMRDGDTIVATDAPLSDLRKLLSLFTAPLQPAVQLSQF